MHSQEMKGTKEFKMEYTFCRLFGVTGENFILLFSESCHFKNV
jgi:hypothetical protein